VDWTFNNMPSPDQLEAVAERLEAALKINVLTLSFYHNWFVVEVDTASYDIDRLPDHVAGRKAAWGVEGTVWDFTDSLAVYVRRDPDTDIPDEITSNPIQSRIRLAPNFGSFDVPVTRHISWIRTSHKTINRSFLFCLRWIYNGSDADDLRGGDVSTGKGQDRFWFCVHCAKDPWYGGRIRERFCREIR
jgi:hypothetical protein